jgi:hypothetical protein
MSELCRHCQTKKACRPRVLCWNCYYADGVRYLYPVSTSKFAHRGIRNDNQHTLSLPAPTDALPGSPEKQAILAERAAAGESLWHPGDARLRHRRIKARARFRVCYEDLAEGA